MDNPWQFSRTLGPLTLRSQEMQAILYTIVILFTHFQDGEVIGIHTLSKDTGLAFAIPSDFFAMTFLEKAAEHAKEQKRKLKFRIPL